MCEVGCVHIRESVPVKWDGCTWSVHVKWTECTCKLDWVYLCGVECTVM